ncbi:C40 family peptidase [Chitinophaga horti]|uniref:C40 family peptidase n=1 Tax=Chitinophaga horti TaxID=2920382 RepID=A0ABY6JBE8_9BACT|nr:C40 family peptidase [Chitinophaga horti]UYQ95902.1 C40 family peptidase [Chitinophaga horti]
MMIRKGNLLIQLSFCLLVLASCSSARKTTSAGKKGTEKPAAKNDKVAFIDDISISREAKTTTHRYNGRNTNTRSRDDRRSGADIENAASWQFKYAQLLDVAVEEVTNERLFNFIEEWWGTPYRMGGNTRSGIDCSHFATNMLLEVFKAGISYGNSADLYNQSRKLSRKELQYGDLVFFKINRKSVSHVGVYLENDRFVHASVSSGVMISTLNEDYWKKYFIGGGRLN